MPEPPAPAASAGRSLVVYPRCAAAPGSTGQHRIDELTMLPAPPLQLVALAPLVAFGPPGAPHHRGLVLLFAVAALLAFAPVLWRHCLDGWTIPGVGVVAAIALVAVELLGGDGPVHSTAPLPAPVWGALEGLAAGVILAALGAVVGRAPWLGGEESSDVQGRLGSPAGVGSGPVRAVAGVLVVAAVVQFSLGIGQRAERAFLIAHALLGIAAILPLAVRLGIVATLGSPARKAVRFLALAVVAVVALQTVLGVGLLLPRAALWVGPWTKTLHHALGGLLVTLLAATFSAARAQAIGAVRRQSG